VNKPTVDPSKRILMLHKPKELVVTRPKSPDAKTVYSLLPPEFHAQGWVPVGRLDKDSTGLLLFVREGFLVRLLQTPKNIDKVYEVWIKGRLRPEHLVKILEGVPSALGLLKAKAIHILGVVGPNSLVKVVLDEGKNRHIRRMFSGLKDIELKRFFKVRDLSRTSIGPIRLDLEPGQWRFLTADESEALLNCVVKKR